MRLGRMYEWAQTHLHALRWSKPWQRGSLSFFFKIAILTAGNPREPKLSYNFFCKDILFGIDHAGLRSRQFSIVNAHFSWILLSSKSLSVQEGAWCVMCPSLHTDPSVFLSELRFCHSGGTGPPQVQATGAVPMYRPWRKPLSLIAMCQPIGPTKPCQWSSPLPLQPCLPQFSTLTGAFSKHISTDMLWSFQ